MIEKTDIGKILASDNVLKNRHVVVNFQWIKMGKVHFRKST